MATTKHTLYPDGKDRKGREASLRNRLLGILIM